MFQRFSRNLTPDFKARSADRDLQTDRTRAVSIMAAIEQALAAAELEQAGLGRRVENVMARAAVTFGNGTDEYLEREALDSHHHDLFDDELTNGQRRLRQLEHTIAHYKVLKAEAFSRFSGELAAAESDTQTALAGMR